MLCAISLTPWTIRSKIPRDFYLLNLDCAFPPCLPHGCGGRAPEGEQNKQHKKVSGK